VLWTLPWRALPASRHQNRRYFCPDQPAPAIGAIVGNDVLEHGGEGRRVDPLTLTHGHSAGGRIGMAASDDTLWIRDDRAVVKKDVDMVVRRLDGADVALEDEVRTFVRLIVSVTSGSAAWTKSRTSRQMACCQAGRAVM